jgi:hypothetical protein
MQQRRAAMASSMDIIIIIKIIINPFIALTNEIIPSGQIWTHDYKILIKHHE